MVFRPLVVPPDRYVLFAGWFPLYIRANDEDPGVPWGRLQKNVLICVLKKLFQKRRLRFNREFTGPLGDRGPGVLDLVFGLQLSSHPSLLLDEE